MPCSMTCYTCSKTILNKFLPMTCTVIIFLWKEWIRSSCLQWVYGVMKTGRTGFTTVGPKFIIFKSPTNPWIGLCCQTQQKIPKNESKLLISNPSDDVACPFNYLHNEHTSIQNMFWAITWITTKDLFSQCHSVITSPVITCHLAVLFIVGVLQYTDYRHSP